MADVKYNAGPWTPAGSTGYGDIEGHRVVSPRGYILAVAIGDVPELHPEANARLIASTPDLLSDGWTLAVLALQSKRYGEDATFRDAVDAMLDTCRVARGEPTREQQLAAMADPQS